VFPLQSAQAGTRVPVNQDQEGSLQETAGTRAPGARNKKPANKSQARFCLFLAGSFLNYGHHNKTSTFAGSH
jgi:hypothetical protein